MMIPFPLSRLGAVVLLLLALALSLPAYADTSPHPKTQAPVLDTTYAGTPAPATPFLTRTGQKRHLGDYRGKIVVLNLWASWCAPCLEELPALGRLQEALNPADVVVVPLSMDMAGWQAVDRYWASKGPKTLTPLLDKSMAMGRALGAKGLPLTVLYSREGQEIGRVSGGEAWDSPAATALIRTLANQRKRATTSR